MFKNISVKLILITFISVVFMGLALAILDFVDLGNEPFTYMNLSISKKIGWSFGNWQVFINVIMFIPVIIFGRKHIGIGTVFNMVLVGYSVELFTHLLNLVNFNQLMTGLLIRVIIMLPAIVIFVFAAATYMTTGLGMAPNDALPFLISGAIKKIDFKWIRLVWDFLVVFIGYIFSEKLGIVSILMVLFMGQTISFVQKRFFTKKDKDE